MLAATEWWAARRRPCGKGIAVHADNGEQCSPLRNGGRRFAAPAGKASPSMRIMASNARRYGMVGGALPPMRKGVAVHADNGEQCSPLRNGGRRVAAAAGRAQGRQATAGARGGGCRRAYRTAASSYCSCFIPAPQFGQRKFPLLSRYAAGR